MNRLPPALRYRIIEFGAVAVMRSLFLTIRCRRVGDGALRRLRAGGTPFVLVFWHDNLLPVVHYHSGEGIVALVSRHGDGEIVARILDRTGNRSVRGSSTRGGMKGLRELVRAGRKGRDLALTPDGPRGPRRVFKAGALTAAQLTGFPIIPVAARATSEWRLRSWDRFMIPKPFTTIELHYGSPHWVPRRTPREERRRQASILQRTLNALAGETPSSSSDEGAERRGSKR